MALRIHPVGLRRLLLPVLGCSRRNSLLRRAAPPPQGDRTGSCVGGSTAHLRTPALRLTLLRTASALSFHVACLRFGKCAVSVAEGERASSGPGIAAVDSAHGLLLLWLAPYGVGLSSPLHTAE